jgi:hypothetical protein
LTTYFSKNMIVILLTTTILTNLITMFKNREYSIMMMEGFTQEEIVKLKTKMDDAKAEMDNEKDDKKKASLKVTYEAAKKTYDQAVATADVNATADKSVEASKPAAAPATSESDNTMSMGAQPANTVKQPFTSKNSAVKDGMSQLSPAAVNAEAVNPAALMKAPGMAIGTNAQKEQAYDTMASIGGGSDTMNQQTEMINNLKSIEPILNTAQNFLEKFENSSISKMLTSGGGFPGMSLLSGALGGNKTSPAPVGV